MKITLCIMLLLHVSDDALRAPAFLPAGGLELVVIAVIAVVVEVVSEWIVHCQSFLLAVIGRLEIS